MPAPSRPQRVPSPPASGAPPAGNVWRTRLFAEDTITDDPETGALRFAQFAIRCCCCGLALTEDRSKVYGIGPECRRGLPHAYLSSLVEKTKAAYGSAA